MRAKGIIGGTPRPVVKYYYLPIKKLINSINHFTTTLQVLPAALAT